MPTHTAPHLGNRVAVVLSVAALVMSAGFASAPAIARALNADTVDHKSAVGAGSSVKERKGKLVATDKRTGRLPDNIIGTAPDALRARTATEAGHAARADSATTAAQLGGRPATAYLSKAEVNEVVPLGGAPTLPPVQVTTSSTTFTTSASGRLLLDLTGTGQLTCATSSFVRWWIQVDGVPVPSTSLQLGEAVAIDFSYNGFPAIRLAGVTAATIAPGSHTIALAGGCTSGASGGSAISGTPAVGAVTVLANGLAGAAPARHPTERRSCLATVAGRSCR